MINLLTNFNLCVITTMWTIFILFLYFDYCEFSGRTKDAYLYITLMILDIILSLQYKNTIIQILFGIWILLRILAYFLQKVRVMERLFNEIHN